MEAKEIMPEDCAKGMAWNTLNFAINPVSTAASLKAAVMFAERVFLPNERPPMALMYRGQDSDVPLITREFVGLDLNMVEKAIKEMHAICRAHFGGRKSDLEIYFLMRHAGLPLQILDWSNSWMVALWFAIHSRDGRLKKDGASLWAFRPVFGKRDGVATFYPSDSMACELSKRQEGFAFFLHFDKGEDGALWMIPMECDPIYGPRLLRIPLQGDYSAMERELRERDPSIEEITKAESPLPEDVVEKCWSAFETITKK